MERWLQISCDGCGETDCNTGPNQTAKVYREEMAGFGWRKVGRFDYCARCVKAGVHRTGESIFEHTEAQGG